MKTPRSAEANLEVPGSNPPDSIDWNAALAENDRWLRNVLRCRVNDSHVVDDLAQEIALAVFRQKSRPTDPQKVAPWLYRLAVRYVINHHRRQGRQKKLVDTVQNGYTNTEHSADAIDWLIHSEQREILQSAMSTLRAQDREILILKYTENWTYAQLAQHLGASLNTIEYRLLRAKKRLRQLLAASSVHEAIS